MPTETSVDILLYPISGGKAITLCHSEIKPTGENREVYQIGDVPKGTYLLTLRTKDSVSSHLVILTR